MRRRMNAFPPLERAGVQVWIDQTRPIAVLRPADGPDRIVRWPRLFTGWAEPAVTVAAAPHGVWVHYGLLNSVSDDDPLAPFVNDVDAPAVHIDIATGAPTVIHIGREQVLGATRHGLWTTDHVDPDPDPETRYRGGPLPSDWREDTDITIRRPDGTARSITVDRSALAVEESGRQVRLLVHASPPVAIPGDGGSTSYEYRPTELLLPADPPLPSTVRFRDPVPTGWGIPVDLDLDHGWRQRSTMPTTPITDAPEVDGDWDIIDMPDHLQHVVVRAAVKRFEHLEQYWHPSDGGPAHPLSDGLHDANITVEGDFPTTRIHVTFRHPAFPEGRMRRTLHVYDSAGRAVIDDYAAIWLMEDLDTGALPPVTSAVDGILDI